MNQAVTERALDITSSFRIDSFMPFNPTDKRTEARVTDLRAQRQFRVTKGAPHIIRSLADADPALQLDIDRQINAMASRGFRSLGVAISYDNYTWEFVGTHLAWRLHTFSLLTAVYVYVCCGCVCVCAWGRAVLHV